jgi:hypothetical protein
MGIHHAVSVRASAPHPGRSGMGCTGPALQTETNMTELQDAELRLARLTKWSFGLTSTLRVSDDIFADVWSSDTGMPARWHAIVHGKMIQGSAISRDQAKREARAALTYGLQWLRT